MEKSKIDQLLDKTDELLDYIKSEGCSAIVLLGMKQGNGNNCMAGKAANVNADLMIDGISELLLNSEKNPNPIALVIAKAVELAEKKMRSGYSTTERYEQTVREYHESDNKYKN